MKTILNPVLAVLVLSHAFAFEANEREQWFEEQRAILEGARQSADGKAIEKLADEISGMGFHQAKASEEYKQLYREFQQTLMSIPGWADYLGNRVRAARDRVEAEPDPNMKHSLIYRELKPAAGGFGTMKHLPSPDTVRVLGEFLGDERGRFIQDPAHPLKGEALWAAWETRTSNCEYALMALADLPLVGKPTECKGRPDFDTDVPAWREWYERVKSGRATFRFEGDPVEYDLNGPASPEKLARIKANRDRDTDRERRRTVSASDGEASATVTSDTPLESAPAMSRHLPLLLGVVFLLASMVWYFLRRERRNPM